MPYPSESPAFGPLVKTCWKSSFCFGNKGQETRLWLDIHKPYIRPVHTERYTRQGCASNFQASDGTVGRIIAEYQYPVFDNDKDPLKRGSSDKDALFDGRPQLGPLESWSGSASDFGSSRVGSAEATDQVDIPSLMRKTLWRCWKVPKTFLSI